MDLTPYIATLQRELATAAEAGGPEAAAIADRLTAPLDSAARLVLLEALSAATAEITREMAPGSVELRLRGRDPEFVVATEQIQASAPPTPGFPGDIPPAAGEQEAGTTRTTVRLPDNLKSLIDQAADRAKISVNTWLIRAAAAALKAGETATPPPTTHRYSGWVR